MIREFDCVECGCHIHRFGMSADEIALCAECLNMPGWFEIPLIRRLLDPMLEEKSYWDIAK
jgi:hypothetical protein